MNQRWDNHKDKYVHPETTINTKLFDVARINETSAKRFVIVHHYSASYPAARFRFGLWKREILMGVAVFSVPCNPKTLDVIPGEADEKAELGRFVLLDEVEGNGETWFLARCFEELRREGLNGVVSFSDPVPRLGFDQRLVMPGHVGTIYQAHNAIYLGRGTARTLRILPNGQVFSDRTAQKIRKLERGWNYAAEILMQAGAHGPLTEGDNLRAKLWLDKWLPLITRPLRHPGNHKYVWALKKSLRRHLPQSLPYPKKVNI